LHTWSSDASVTARPITDEIRQERLANRFLAMIPTHLRSHQGTQEVEPTAKHVEQSQEPQPLPVAAEEARKQLLTRSKAHAQARRTKQVERLAELLEAPTDTAEFYVPSSHPQTPRVTVRLTPPAPKREGPDWAACHAEAVLADLEARGFFLSAGAKLVYRELHRLGVGYCQEQRYGMIPTTVTFHLPQVLLGVLVEYTPRHLRRSILNELEAAELIDCGAQASRVDGVNKWNGSLWCVKLLPGTVTPFLRAEDWEHQWRDFQRDLKAGRTAKKLMSYLESEKAKLEEIFRACLCWAVNPGEIEHPLILDRTCEEAVQDVVYALPSLAELEKKAEAVGKLASALAAGFHDQHSRRWYCSLIWAALKAEKEGRGGLNALANAIQRVFVDQREWAELRNPAALLAARLSAA